jgi:glycosyltransferase involved in cell wall biosynthesis
MSIASAERALPRVSVCIPTHNSRAMLPKALEELSKQEFKDYEVVICDDASSDGTWEYLRALELPNSRIFRNAANMNLPGTMKRLFDAAWGEFIAIHHDHEFAKPCWLSRMIEIVDKYPGVGMVIPGYDAIHTNGEYEVRRSRKEEEVIFAGANPLPGGALIKILALRANTPISAHGAVFRRSCVRKAGGYSDVWGLASDEDLYRRVAVISSVAFCAEPVVVCVDRPEARQFSLGSYVGLYTIFAYRKDTIRRFWRASLLAKEWQLGRVSLLKGKALLRETVYLWMFGKADDLQLALAWNKVPTLPSGRQPLSTCGRLAVRVLVWVFTSLAGLGHWVGRWRRRMQRRAA